ncbi:MAG: TRAP transporter large permease [Rhodobacter sp.]|uniref:TRAP transporter large permease n=1 Tax=Pararhodobacter sp. TaxID=2127056 RepID=UPI002CABB48D|nr:TRAP transporter large permease [Pararhodobacter sp.]MCC0074457.1 TRAP transporter large permease [Rhodobacter sp.]HPD93171.1 TRAP transporter large permease [Pararhodobacter sp.]
MKSLGFILGLGLLIALSLPVAAILGDLAIVMDALWNGGRLQRTFGGFLWEKSSQYLLLSIPLFVLLGEINLRSGIAARMYGAVAKWISWLPGGLMHANIGASAIFAATSGSSVATSATIGTVAYPEIARNGYDEALFLGSIAAGGTLGILIPPSVTLIVYGVLTQSSVPELYMAGIIPGLLLAALFSAVIGGLCVMRPGLAGQPVRASWGERLRALKDLGPPMVIFLGVIGTIYAGLATPTEAASIGVVLSLILAAANRTLSARMLLDSFEGTVRTTSMIMLIILAAMILNIVVGYFGAIQAATQLVADLGLQPWQLMVVVVVFYLVIGMFMETFSMMLTTIGIVFPLVTSMGYDPIWFGVIVVLLMEAALITPPIGVNLFVVQGIRSTGAPFRDVCIGATPFLGAMLVLIVLLIVFPGLATWLPDLVYQR